MINCYQVIVRGLLKDKTWVNVTKEVVSMPCWGKLLPSNCKRAFGGRNLVFVCLYSTLPEDVSHLL